MGFNFSFFGESQHRTFNYKPRYYDPEKEERKRLFGKVDGSGDAPAQAGGKDEGYTPGKYIQGSLRDGNYQRNVPSGAPKAQKIIGAVGLLLFFAVLYYFVKYYMMIFD